MTTARYQATRLADLLRREQADMADFLVALAEFDRGKAWLDLGYSSLFYFLHRELGLSKGSAHYRKTAAELIQTFPEIVEPLRDGRLCISSIVQVAKVLTPDNCRDVLPMFFQRSKRDAMAVAATLQPETAAPHRDVVTAVRPPQAARLVQPVEPDVAATAGSAEPVPAGQHCAPPDADPASGGSATPAGTWTSATAAPRDSAQPLTADLARLHVTVSRGFLDKLEAARAALSHVAPDATTEAVLEAGLDLLLRRQASRKGLTDRPRKGQSQHEDSVNDGPYVPAAVKREVWKRDGGRCQWPIEGGGACGSATRVEFDHVIPRALGGKSTPDNIRLLCRFHNDLAARRTFGDQWMDRFTRGPGAGAPAAQRARSTTASG